MKHQHSSTTLPAATVDDEISKETSGNGTSVQTAKSSPAEDENFAKSNGVLLAWLIFLTLGGSLLALYYADIKYLPEIEWTSSLIYIAIASMIGGAVAIVLSLSLLIPGVIWNVFLVCDDTLRGVFCYQEGEHRRDPSVFDIFLKLGVPFGLVLIASHLSLFWDVKAYVVTCLVLLTISTLNRYARFDELVKEKKPRLDDENSPTNWSQLFKRVFARVRQEIVFTFRGLNLLNQLILRSRIADDDKRVMKHTFWFELTIALGQLAILLIYLLSKPQRSSLLILTAICTIAVLVSNTVVAMLHTYHPRQAVMASAICALVILGVANQYSPLPRGIMSLYGFGENTKFTFFLNDDGTKLIERFGLANQACSDGPSNPGRLCNVQVLSALGNDYYLKIGNVNITVPKSMVVARKTEKPTE